MGLPTGLVPFGTLLIHVVSTTVTSENCLQDLRSLSCPEQIEIRLIEDVPDILEDAKLVAVNCGGGQGDVVKRWAKSVL